MDSRIVDVAIGLAFVFATVAGLVSLITAGVASLLQLRTDFLLRGLRSLLDGDHKAATASFTNELLNTGLFVTQGRKTPAADAGLDVSANVKRRWHRVLPAGRRKLRTSREALDVLPSYISSRTFARSLVVMLAVGDPDDPTIDRVRDSIANMGETPLRTSLITCLNVAEGHIDRFHAAVEQWYDDHMDRVSGWYKRHLSRISFAVGVVLVLLLNANAIRIGEALWTDGILRDAIAGQAIAAAGADGACPQAVATEPDSGADAGDEQDAAAPQVSATEFRECLAQLRTDLAEAAGAGLPLLWRTSPLCVADEALEAADCSVWERWGLTDPASDGFGSDLQWLLVVIAGWALFAFALVPGGRWWYDILKRLGTLRGSGPPPPTGPSEPPTSTPEPGNQ